MDVLRAVLDRPVVDDVAQLGAMGTLSTIGILSFGLVAAGAASLG
jgi:hypothetical protein